MKTPTLIQFLGKNSNEMEEWLSQRKLSWHVANVLSGTAFTMGNGRTDLSFYFGVNDTVHAVGCHRRPPGDSFGEFEDLAVVGVYEELELEWGISELDAAQSFKLEADFDDLKGYRRRDGDVMVSLSFEDKKCTFIYVTNDYFLAE